MSMSVVKQGVIQHIYSEHPTYCLTLLRCEDGSFSTIILKVKRNITPKKNDNVVLMQANSKGLLIKDWSIVSYTLGPVASTNSYTREYSNWELVANNGSIDKMVGFERIKGILQVLQANGINNLYHFTDKRNWDSIQQYGGLFSWGYMQGNGIAIPYAGGDDLSRSLDIRKNLSDYVRLSFCKDHPMMYRLKQQGYDLVLLKIDIIAATLDGTLFSDINATDNDAHIGGTIDDLKRIDFAATQESYVKKDSPSFKLHQAEVLIKTKLPIDYIIETIAIKDEVLLTITL